MGTDQDKARQEQIRQFLASEEGRQKLSDVVREHIEKEMFLRRFRHPQEILLEIMGVVPKDPDPQ